MVKAERPGISPVVVELSPVPLDEKFKKAYLSFYKTRVGQYLPVDADIFRQYP